MKKIPAILLAAVIVLSIAACGKKTEDNGTTAANTTETSVSITTEEITTLPETQPKTEPESTTEEMDVEFLVIMMRYETLMEQYTDFIKIFIEAEDKADLMDKYQQYADIKDEANEMLNTIKKEELNESELAYYNEVIQRVEQYIANLNPNGVTVPYTATTEYTTAA